MKSPKKKVIKQNAPAQAIVFGFGRATDERSLQLFLQRFADRKLQDVLVPRLLEEDILATVDFLTAIMQKYLSDEEYHTLFLTK